MRSSFLKWLLGHFEIFPVLLSDVRFIMNDLVGQNRDI